MSQVVEPSSIAERAKDALQRHAWREAYDMLVEADEGGGLDPTELMLLADAAWWVGKLPKAIDVLERAHAAALKADDRDTAVKAAILLGKNHVLRGQHPVATAWLRRAERLLEGVPENVGHGWLAVTRAFQAGLAGPVETTLAQADIADGIAARLGDPNLAAMAMTCRGMGLVMAGQPAEGLALLDEAAVAAVGGGLDADTAGSVCCATIGACTSLGDTGRAVQWIEAQDRWCEREHINGYPGMCRLYRSEIKSLRGSWLEAEAEARRASEELQGFIPAAAGLASYIVGELRLRRGDLDGAEEALLAAHAVGQAEPALSLLRLAQGRTEAALDGIRRAVEAGETSSWHSTPNSAMSRAELLPAYVEIAVAAGDLDRAASGAADLATLAELVGSAMVRARAAVADAAVLLGRGDARGAVDAARRGVGFWREVDAPWETARARALLGEALVADGASDAAAVELRAAQSVFESLEAGADLRRVNAALASAGVATGDSARSPATRVLRTFVFTDIVDSTRHAEELGDERWGRVLQWHDRTVRRRLGEHGGEEIKRTGDGFFLAFDDTDRAIEFSIDLQRAFASPPPELEGGVAVRIGIHRAEANRSGLDYVGTGVNVAARVAGAAGTGEILVSHATIDGARRTYPTTDARTLELRGVSRPVDVASVGWR